VQLSYSVLRLPKEGNTLDQCEDAAAYSSEFGIAAVSDGASSAFESGRWAHLLTRAFVDRPPPTSSDAEVLDWVGQVSAEWSASMAASKLTFYEEMKVDSEGSAATLVGVFLEEAEPEADGGTWQCMALGDSCLFQISEGELATAMPLVESAQFGQNPPLFYTQRDLTERDLASLDLVKGVWHSGDSFLLMTDAIAAWFLRDYEDGGKPWDVLAELDADSFAAFVADLRRMKRIRNDDVTIVRLEPAAAPVTGPPHRPAEPRRHRRTKSGGRPQVPVGGPAPSGPTHPPTDRTRSPRGPNRPSPGPSHPTPGPARLPSGPTSAPPRPPSGLTSGPPRPPSGATSGPPRPPSGPPQTLSGPPRSPGEAGSARPPSGRRPAHLRAAALMQTRRTFVVALSLGLLIGIAIGWTTWGSSTSSPSPVITLSPSPIATPSPSSTLGGPPSAEEEVQAAARQFVLAMVNFHGDLSEYESSLRALSTPALAESLPKLLGLGSLTSGSADSNGRVISSAVDSSTDSTAVVYLVVDQEVATAPAFHSHQQILLIRLEMALSGTSWQTNEIMFVNSAGQMLPQPTSDTSSSPRPSVSPTDHGT
jgi:hypothetical protein